MYEQPSCQPHAGTAIDFSLDFVALWPLTTDVAGMLYETPQFCKATLKQ
jgi:hypothetical protein